MDTLIQPMCYNKHYQLPRTPKREGMGFFNKLKNYKQVASDASCPHCNVILDPIPQRKTRCRACGNDIYVRTNPFNKQKIYYLKHEDALSLDTVKNLPISEKEYDKTEKELAKKFGKPPMPGDVVWGILNNHLVSAMQRNDWQDMKMIYWQQARLLFESGQEFFGVLQESAKCELHRYKVSNVVHKVEILTAGSSCSKCQSLQGKIITVKEALVTMPIPVKDCENIFCRCTYLAVVE
jgi:hypothetical protein